MTQETWRTIATYRGPDAEERAAEAIRHLRRARRHTDPYRRITPTPRCPTDDLVVLVQRGRSQTPDRTGASILMPTCNRNEYRQ